MFGSGQSAGDSVREAIAARFGESGAVQFGITPERFEEIVLALVGRYAAAEDCSEQLALIRALHVQDLVLARACADGSDPAWDAFLTRFRPALYAAASRIAGNDALGRELADELYAELYGLRNKDGRRVCRLDYYMGRGSLEGWLRTVLSQQYVNRYRSRSREVSLDERIEQGASFASSQSDCETPATVLGTAVAEELKSLEPEDRLVLASWYLDRRTLAQIGKQLGVHESTVSRRLDRVMQMLRKRIRKRLLATGWSARQCDEQMAALDVRDLDVNVSASLKQESALESFPK
jgi:RNA polymerase sigma-70 factor (ECF subfamily)